MQIRSSFIDNEIREMTPKDPRKLKESYVEYYDSVPFQGNNEYSIFSAKKKASAVFFYYAKGFVSDYYAKNKKNIINLNERISILRDTEEHYAKETLSYLKEMDEIKQKALAHPLDIQAQEKYDLLKSKLTPFVELSEVNYDNDNGRSFFQEVFFFYESVRPTYVLDINPIIDSLLHNTLNEARYARRLDDARGSLGREPDTNDRKWGFNFNDREGQEIIDTWLSIGEIPAVKKRYCQSLNGKHMNELEQ